MIKKIKKVGGLNKKINFYLFIFFIIFISLFYNSAKAIIINDYEIESLLNEIIEPVVNTSKIKLNDEYFYIVLSEKPNAYVDPMNRIFITTGFISTVDDPEGLAGVIAHEIGHIKSQHMNKRIANYKDNKNLLNISSFLSLSASILSKNPEIFIGSNIASNQILTSNFINYTKDQEREADKLGLEYLEEAKITSNGLINLLEKLIEISMKVGFDETELNLITHPYKIDRIKYIKKFQEKSNYNESIFSNKIHLRFSLIQGKISGHTLSLENIKLKYQKVNTDEKDYALAIAYAKEGFLKESINKINNLINKFPENEFLYETKGEILLSFGYRNEAISFFDKSLNMNKNNDYLRIKMVEYLYKDIKNFHDANQVLEHVNKIEADVYKNNKLLNIISKTYEYLNKKDWQYLYLSKIELNYGNFDQAIYYLNQSKKFTEDKEIIIEIEKIRKKINNEKNE